MSEKISLCYKKIFIVTLNLFVMSSSVITQGECANILFVASFPALSHYQMLEPLILSLAQRGHHITVLSHFPQKEPVKNIQDIDLTGVSPPYQVKFSPWSLFDDMFELFHFGSEQCRIFTEHEKIQKFLETKNKFDLIFIEAFDSDCCLGFVAKFKAPFILFSALALPVWESDWIYNPTEPSYYPDNLCRLPAKISFYNKLQNIGCHLFFRTLYWFQNVKTSLKVVRNSFKLQVNTLEDLKRNVGLIFVNSFHGITGPRPFFPNIIEIGGIHIKPTKPLPREIDSFLNQSQNGAIVISMGSIVKSHTLVPELRRAFLEVISRLEERVLWKWEADFPNKSENLMTVPWIPQSDVLGHSKVKAFVSHGGIHSLYEAVYHGVPIVGIPLFGDQIGNLKALEAKGVAIVIDFPNLREETLTLALNSILKDKRYKERAERLSKIFRDRPQTPLENAVFWAEYVLRHQGAPHFQSGASNLSWLQYYSVDVIFTCIFFLIIFIVVFRYLFKFLKILILSFSK